MVYLWVDGVYGKAGLEKEKAAVLVAVVGLKDGRRVVVVIEPGYRESGESWLALLRDLKATGMSRPFLVTDDGHPGISGALRNHFPEADKQRWRKHKVSVTWSRRLKDGGLLRLVYERRFPVHTVEQHRILEEAAV